MHVGRPIRPLGRPLVDDVLAGQGAGVGFLVDAGGLRPQEFAGGLAQIHLRRGAVLLQPAAKDARVAAPTIQGEHDVVHGLYQAAETGLAGDEGVLGSLQFLQAALQFGGMGLHLLEQARVLDGEADLARDGAEHVGCVLVVGVRAVTLHLHEADDLAFHDHGDVGGRERLALIARRADHPRFRAGLGEDVGQRCYHLGLGGEDGLGAPAEGLRGIRGHGQRGELGGVQNLAVAGHELGAQGPRGRVVQGNPEHRRVHELGHVIAGGYVDALQVQGLGQGAAQFVQGLQFAVAAGQRLFHLFALGDVGDGSHVPHEVALGIGLGDGLPDDPGDLPVGPEEAVFGGGRGACLCSVGPAGGDVVPVLGMHDLKPAVGQGVLSVQPGNLAPARVDVGRLALGVRSEDAHRRHLGQGLVPLLAVAERLFCALALGDVGVDGDDADDPALYHDGGAGSDDCNRRAVLAVAHHLGGLHRLAAQESFGQAHGLLANRRVGGGDQFVYVPAQRLVAGVAEERLGAEAPLHDSGLGIQDCDRVGRAGQHALQEQAPLLRLALHLLALGDVADDAEQGRAARHRNDLGGEQADEGRPVLLAKPGFLVARGHPLHKARHDAGPLVGLHPQAQVLAGLAEHLIAGVVGRLQEAVVDLYVDAGLHVGDGDEVGGTVEDGAEFGLAFAQGLQGLPALVAGALALQRALHGGPEAGEVVLEHVVGRARAHALRGYLFVGGPRCEDKGDVQAALLHQAQGLEAGEGGQEVVGQDDVPAVGEACDELGLRGDAAELGVVPGAPQFPQHQFGVFRPVFQDQNAKVHGSPLPQATHGIAPRRAPCAAFVMLGRTRSISYCHAEPKAKHLVLSC